MNNPIALSVLAHDARSWFHRSNTYLKESEWWVDPETPQWVWSLIGQATPDFTIDSWRACLIARALDAIIEHGDPDAMAPDLTDTYTSELLRWLASSERRLRYVDAAMTDWDLAKDTPIEERIKQGQQTEGDEVFGLVREALCEEQKVTKLAEAGEGLPTTTFALDVAGPAVLVSFRDDDVLVTDGELEKQLPSYEWEDRVARATTMAGRVRAKYDAALVLLGHTSVPAESFQR